MSTHSNSQQIHATAVKVFDCGVLLLGKSGCGKSSTALALLDRGHHLISDDAVLIQRQQQQLIALRPNTLGPYLSLHSIGLIDIRKQFISEDIVESVLHCAVEITEHTAPSKPFYPTSKAFTLSGLSLPQYILRNSSTTDLALLIETLVQQYHLHDHQLTMQQFESHNACAKESI